VATVRVGALDPQHRGRLAEILAATAVFSSDEIDVALELFDESSVSGAPAYEFVGAYDDVGALMGYACYGPTPSTNGTYDLYWIAVHPAAQGSGDGSRLLREVERRLAERGGRLLIVETSSRDSYVGTRRFYEARGYAETARVSSFYAPSDDRVVYTKRLTPAAASATTIHSPPPH
jgi:ribosomal protein S18 acetylase RimI-like enzyme